MSDTQPKAAPNKRSVYIYHHDPATELAIAVGKVFVDENGDAWVRINKDDLASAIGVEDIDGVALVTAEQFVRSDE